MSSLAQRLARPEIVSLAPFDIAANNRNALPDAIKLDANENPYPPLVEGPLAAGVNLKSSRARFLPASAAASFGSALAGVKDETGSKLSATATGLFFPCRFAANAGVSTRPAAAIAAAVLAPLCFATLSTFNSLSGSRYSRRQMNVPRPESIPLTPVADSTQFRLRAAQLAGGA